MSDDEDLAAARMSQDRGSPGSVDEDDPMERKLREMRQNIRERIDNDEPSIDTRHGFDPDEDNRGYDAYSSPDGKDPSRQVNSNFSNQVQSIQNAPPTLPEAQHQQPTPLQSQGAIPKQPALPSGLNPNFDKIKNSKLFQKFLEKE